jgi:hypothetical protein
MYTMTSLRLVYILQLGVTLLTASYVTLGALLFSGVESRYLAHQAAVAAAAAESSSPVVMNSTMLLGKHIHFLRALKKHFLLISTKFCDLSLLPVVMNSTMLLGKHIHFYTL